MKTSIYTLLFSLTFSLFMSTSSAQNTGSNQALMEAGVSFVTTFDARDMKAKGSPYLVEDFSPAKISIGNNMIYNVRYNAFNDEFEVKIDEDNIQSLNKDVDKLTITMINGNETFGAINYTDEKTGLNRGYFLFLTPENNTSKLYIKKAKKYIEAKPAVTGYDKDKPAEFRNVNDTYFISVNNGYAMELPRKKKELANLVPGKSKEILNFIKTNKIKTSNQQDLIKLVNFMNTL
ncbi:hypothetical protein SAMN04515667_0186 [Formosa sp. Hel1_31_208]|uniref:hypothetical protein n=1 Tax=Formosa sp. Hel1_31_208 TaxID=1798225 RepID=UPI00087A0D7F|nr:hypothetical protein [Formosa sp. Hel1_31_208]SDR67191.1 hypothetical protein SAMN04515667_0186 [Formosa sp. Hel1_31_208]